MTKQTAVTALMTAYTAGKKLRSIPKFNLGIWRMKLTNNSTIAEAK